MARWIASKDNPLAARVAINHMWLRHFGKPLVPTVFNFGRNGKPASHPELLDWLATEFMERNWDMKSMHRLMVTSSAYRLRSSGYSSDAPQVKRDPDNVWLWRASVHRMEAETVRDSMLALAGKLDTKMYGPDIETEKGEEIYRRSIYFRHAPDMQVEMLKVFDVASPNECFQRSESIVPQQALALANSELSQEMARVLAEQLSEPGEDDFVAASFDRILNRAPSAEEMKASLDYLRSQAALYSDVSRLTPFAGGQKTRVKRSSDPAQRARESLIHVLFNHNDFVTVR